jgi:hypothetical protein
MKMPFLLGFLTGFCDDWAPNLSYHSSRLLPLVVADSASFFYDTKLDIKILAEAVITVYSWYQWLHCSLQWRLSIIHSILYR